MKLVSSFPPPLFVCVSNTLTYTDEYSPVAGAGGAVVGRRGSWSFDSGTLRKPHRGGFAAWPWFDVSVRFGVYMCLYVHVCLCARVFADNKEQLTGPTRLHRADDVCARPRMAYIRPTCLIGRGKGLVGEKNICFYIPAVI